MTQTNIKKQIANGCNTSLNIIARYYGLQSEESIEDFVLFPSEDVDENSGQILFEENIENEEFFIGIQFGKKIYHEFENKNIISLNTLAVVAEETSHFKLITDSVLLKSSLSKLEIETLGEIDRFLCLMHWNNENKTHRIEKNWKNLHQICDEVFQGNRFKENKNPLYIDAEAIAFKHLRQAFSKDWDSSYFNFSLIDIHACNYLTKLRKMILRA
ncbi:hypothetical protein [Fluviispira multicolorata]|uniref:Uncharacterized protein n=1 Tax=Fluviispira multicolorata TaxID=2654512 RepID=A0A833JEC8_9BACT|nr:hypothetical protein [Fluviispira multicolorata]KAB8031819.1 hypothetical protein GCL57_04030 [Fluviispira multicolorata]